MAIRLDIMLTASTKEEMMQIAEAINKQIDTLYQQIPHMIVNVQPTRTNQDQSITETITLIVVDDK